MLPSSLSQPSGSWPQGHRLEPGQDLGQNPAQEPGQEPGQVPGREPGREPGQEPGQERAGPAAAVEGQLVCWGKAERRPACVGPVSGAEPDWPEAELLVAVVAGEWGPKWLQADM